jgi:hypothetical protein
MARLKPNIDIGSITTKRDRESFQNFVLEVIKDTFIYEATPTSISLNGELFTLNLNDFRFVYEDLVVADSKDYLDVYLYGVKQTNDRYSVTFDDTSITITFTESITRVPADVVRTDFEIKGKITQIV